ncbi:MAG: hypothetical protein ACL7BU_14560 [Candidatus Phlomobacter fragariae]
MRQDEFLDDIKENFIFIFEETSTEPVDYDNLFIDHKDSLEHSLKDI